MKSKLLSLSLSVIMGLCAFSLSAQTITVHNQNPLCDVWIRFSGTDNPCDPCNITAICVAAGTSTTVNTIADCPDFDVAVGHWGCFGACEGTSAAVAHPSGCSSGSIGCTDTGSSTCPGQCTSISMDWCSGTDLYIN